jgi:hypothetical protein
MNFHEIYILRRYFTLCLQKHLRNRSTPPKMKQATFAKLRIILHVLVISIAMAANFVYVDIASSQSNNRTLNSESFVHSAESGLRTAAGVPVPPRYQIYDIGIVQVGDSASQGFGASTGGVAVGRSVRTGAAQAFSWTLGGGIVGLPNLAGRTFCVSNGANDSGIVAGTCATTLFGSSRLPVIWQNGIVSQLTLPAGETLGDANDINASGVAVGSVNGGSLQRGVIYSGGSATVISQTTSGGSFFVTAFGVNDSGRVVGQGIDPNNAARNVGIVYDIGSGSAIEVGALSGFNGALAFAVSNTGYVVGSSMLNQGSGLPFIWSSGAGIVPIPLATGTSQGSARAVNSAGWVVGNDSSAFSIPFLYNGSATYRLADLIPSGTGWDLSMNTSSSALGISDNNVIVGTGVYNGQTHAYAMVPATATMFDYDGDGKTDVSVFRNSSGNWYISNSSNNSFRADAFGTMGDRIVPGDYDGDNKTDIAVWRPSTGYWYRIDSSTSTFRATNFGLNGDIPAPGDFDGDGKTDICVYRQSSYLFYSLYSSDGSFHFQQVGVIPVDVPVMGDYDGDGKTDFALFRPFIPGAFLIRDSSTGMVRTEFFGTSGDKPIAGDFDADGKTDIAVYRPSTGAWYAIRSRDSGSIGVAWGATGDVPAAGDYDGDGKLDVAVFRPSSGFFYILQSTNGSMRAQQFGAGGDVPTPSAFVP